MSLKHLSFLLCPLFAFLPLTANDEGCGDCRWVAEHLATIPDFPKPGINFVSIGPLLRNSAAFERVIKTFAHRYEENSVDVIAGIDARGFIFGSALAYELNVPFVMIRKMGKLPGDVEQLSYSLEYGSDTLEIEKESFGSGSRALIIDDLLATGGTAQAAAMLVEKLGGQVVEIACLIELVGLGGREKLDYPLFSLMTMNVCE